MSYVIGYNKPLSILVNTFGGGRKTDSELIEIIKKNFDLRPGMIMRYVEALLSRHILLLTLFAYSHAGTWTFVGPSTSVQLYMAILDEEMTKGQESQGSPGRSQSHLASKSCLLLKTSIVFVAMANKKCVILSCCLFKLLLYN